MTCARQPDSVAFPFPELTYSYMMPPLRSHKFDNPSNRSRARRFFSSQRSRLLDNAAELVEIPWQRGRKKRRPSISIQVIRRGERGRSSPPASFSLLHVLFAYQNNGLPVHRPSSEKADGNLALLTAVCHESKRLPQGVACMT